jgi:hypothetical protein
MSVMAIFRHISLCLNTVSAKQNQMVIEYVPAKAEPGGRLGSSMNFNEFLLISVVALLIAVPLIAGPSDRKRIREEIEGNGGTVLTISYNFLAQFWLYRGWGRVYDVIYRTRDGQNATARCRATTFSGLSWISNSPPRL